MQHRAVCSALAIIWLATPAFCLPHIASLARLTRTAPREMHLSADKPDGVGVAIKIKDAFTRPTLGGSTVAVGYMTIFNQGNTADRLISATSDISEKSELHESILSGSTMEMRELPSGLVIPAHGSIEFKPGGYHVMFVGLRHAVGPGQTIHAVLTFEKAGKVPVSFMAASSPGATRPDNSGGMNMDGMKMQ